MSPRSQSSKTLRRTSGASPFRALPIVGSIDPAPPVTPASLFYPTNYPTSRHPKIGPGARENGALSDAANRFKSHNPYNNDHASLMVMGHADVRGL